MRLARDVRSCVFTFLLILVAVAVIVFIVWVMYANYMTLYHSYLNYSYSSRIGGTNTQLNTKELFTLLWRLRTSLIRPKDKTQTVVNVKTSPSQPSP